jgi:hypothetical protein
LIIRYLAFVSKKYHADAELCCNNLNTFVGHLEAQVPQEVHLL